MRAYPTSAVGGAVATFLAGFLAHDVLGPALVHEAGGLPPRSGPGHELEDSSTSSTSTSTSAALACLCPAPPAPKEPEPSPLRVAGTGLDSTVEVPLAVALGVGALVTLAAAARCWSRVEDQALARKVLEPIGESRWQIYTPGNELYAEDFGDYASLIPITGRRRYPPGVRNVVAFNRSLQAAELVSLIRRGRGEAVLEHGPLANGWWAGSGQDWLGGRLDIPAPTAVEVPRARRRLHRKGAEDSDFGQMVPFSAAAILRGRYGLDKDEMGERRPIEYVLDDQADSWRDDKLVAADRQRPPRSALDDRLFGNGGGGAASPPGGPTVAAVAAGTGEEQAEDLRACWIDVDETGSRFKEGRKVVQESMQEVFSDSSLRGPPACLEVCRKMYRHGGAPKIWFQEWCEETGISRRDRAYHEVQTLIERLCLAGTYDQVNVGALASLVVIARRLLQCTEACAHGADHANWAAAKHLAGTTNPLDLVPEALRSYAGRLSKEEHELGALRARAKTPAAALEVAGLGAVPMQAVAVAAAEAEAGGVEAPARRAHGVLGDRAPASLTSHMKMDAISADVQQRVFSAARRWIDVDSAVSEEGALARLLKGKAGYAPLGSTSMGSYEYSRVSLPDSVVDAPPLAAMPPAQAQQYLEEFASRVLPPPQEAALMRELDGLPGCHADPLLLQRPRSYGKFVRRALSIGLVTLTQRPKSVFGLFLVKKRDGARLRLIVDCRRSNALFRPSPGVDLLSGEGLGRVEMPVMEDSSFAGLGAVLGVGDVADCFHRMKLQGDIRHYFCWPPLDAALAGETLVEGRPVRAGEQVWPMSQSLPMGFPWSLYFAQAANQRRLDRQPSLAGSLRLSDRGPPHVLGRGTVGSELGHYMYVDNAGVIGFDAARVTCALQEAQRDFDGDHLKFHVVEVMPEGGRTLGCYLDGRHRATRPTDERFAMVRKGLRCLLRRRKVAGWQLEMVLGHMTFMALVRRDVLSIFHSVYAFVAQNYHAFSELWPTVREELNCLGIMLLLESTWTRPWMPVVYSSDASLYGHGVAEACFGTETVAKIGRVSELARRWELDPSFPEVPSWLLHDSHWATVMADRWAFADDILRLEARALAGRRRTRALSSPGRRLDSGGPPPAQRSRTLDQRRGLAARLVLEGAARPPLQSSVEACLQLSPSGPHLADQAVAGHGVAEVAAESESIESSDVEEPPAAARSRRRLETRGEARVRKAIEVLETTEAGKGDAKLCISYLEKRTVGAGALETYRQCVLAFCVWARCCLTALPELKELDGQLVEYMNEEFLKGVKALRGEKLLAGLMFFHPDFGRLGGLHLPRSLRCLKGWKKLSPSRSRKPLVFAIWAALAVELCRLGAPLVGAMVLIMVECYLRPGEMLSLTSDSFLAPAEHAVQIWVVWLFPEAGVARSKVGSADDTIPCDSGRCPWMCHIFKALKDRQSSRPLLDLSYPQFLCLFRRAATNIGVDVVPYQGRHSGASLDRATGRRFLEEVQKRGRWAAMSSVKRYEKSGRLNESWEKLSDASKAHCAAAANLLQEVLLLGRPALAPPFGGREGCRGLR
ncbi:unnamed protein product [Prorocentrum cordatum]|uniref:DNA-directed DNA polymerase n=1 Tax=Prorocentrum cordatum TaxID=2364126 RepID=A0ABN9T1S8_9DINO|nr:unnamed protein product [Polarella glacialis]